MITIENDTLILDHLKLKGDKESLLRLLTHILAVINNELIMNKDTLLLYVGDIVNSAFIYYELVELDKSIFVRISCALGTVHLLSNGELAEDIKKLKEKLEMEINDEHKK